MAALGSGPAASPRAASIAPPHGQGSPALRPHTAPRHTIEQERRDTILANVEDAVDRAGEIVGRHDWGIRPTVYEVRKHGEADYHLLQFRGPASLLEQLDHNLKITDGILRFRIIRLRPGTPPPPDLRPRRRRRRRRARGRRRRRRARLSLAASAPALRHGTAD